MSAAFNNNVDTCFYVSLFMYSELWIQSGVCLPQDSPSSSSCFCFIICWLFPRVLCLLLLFFNLDLVLPLLSFLILLFLLLLPFLSLSSSISNSLLVLFLLTLFSPLHHPLCVLLCLLLHVCSSLEKHGYQPRQLLLLQASQLLFCVSSGCPAGRRNNRTVVMMMMMMMVMVITVPLPKQ